MPRTSDNSTTLPKRIRADISRVKLSLLDLLIEENPERAAKVLERIRLRKSGIKKKEIVISSDTV